MPVSCNSFLEFAESLDTTREEILRRMVVGRSYYSAYHSSNLWHKALAQPGHNLGPNGGFHQVLINQLANPDSSCTSAQSIRSRVLAYSLRELRDWRHQADYALNDIVTVERAENAKARARQLLAKAAEVLK